MTDPLAGVDQTPEPQSSQTAYRKRTKSKRPLIIGAAIVVVAAVAVAIGFAVSRPAGTTGADAKSELTVGLLLEPTNLNVRETAGVALDQVLVDNVYQGLVGLKSGTLDVEPVLADAVEKSDDGLTYTFTLRDDVTFHSGAKLTADDVVASLSSTLGDTAVVSAPDAATVTVVLPEPDSQLLWRLAGREGLILEAAATNDLNNTANGTGPYTLERWKQGDSITLAKNATYWGEPATLDRAIFRYIPDGKAAVNAALEGELDVQTAVLSDLLPEYDGNEDFTLVRAASTDVFTLAYNSAREPLSDPRVRAALSMAIDSDAVIELLNGDGLPLGGPITEIEPGYEDLTAVNAYDPEAARALLAEAGQQNLSLTLTVPNFYGTTVLDLLVTQFADVGVSLKVNSVEFPTWLQDVYTNHDFDLSYVDHAEPRDFANYANPEYYFGYQNPEVTRLMQESINSLDPKAADELIAEAARIVADDAPAKWVYNYTPSNAVGTHVLGFPESNTNSRINLEGVTIKK
ncbi:MULTISPECIES: ABC transporter substrate-binding protein [unclassified Leucobacter]|uniref:ABC transporter substrate-binding protein n=1 Tax=unclassified Leucobacter TaxID=2621730 RepID=UPI001F13547F|nr:ABC transporter substrate-binding protein [Leucobacter sp. CX169]